MTHSLPFSGVESQILSQVPLNRRTTWRIGGVTRWLATPKNCEELAQLWRQSADDIPRFLLGGGSNILVEDSGFNGLAVNLSQHINQIKLLDDDEGLQIMAEAGASTSALAHFARLHSLTGAEFLGGIPGTIGGAVKMNAGANGGDIAKILINAQLLDCNGNSHIWPVEKLGLGYRKSQIPKGWIFVKGTFKLKHGEQKAIKEKMRQFNQHRLKSQPLNYASAGSTFKNPTKGPAAWKLIDDAGFRGMRIGDAQVSEKHSNFLVNLGKATSYDMLALIDKIREKVIQKTGESLNLEVAILGPQGFRGKDL
ncbi:MAG: UDP-N-acetylmuramate dehydrogenase [Magnetococcales bacterium]|nr:UDP-N-acetylmuramate dehydrogenase [Magnetococcales bacterium]